MTETWSTSLLNESIATLQTTSNHHSKDIEEIHQVIHVHTRTLNEMNQQLIAILQKFSITEEDQSKNPQTSQTPQTNQPRNAVIFSPRLFFDK